MKPHRDFRVTVAAMVLAVAATAMIGNVSATSANTDLTDIWWNPQKSGMGFQLINTGTFTFATGFIYGPNNQPTWFYANLNKTATNPITYSGNLGVATGPYFGGPFNQADVTRRVAGTMTFVLTSNTAGQLSYSIDGVFVSEPVERQPLTLDNYGATYHGVLSVVSSQCDDGSPDFPASVPITLNISQTEAVMSQHWQLGDFGCTYPGTYSQFGRMGVFHSDFSCEGGGFGTLTMFQMTNEPRMFMAQVSIVNNEIGCHTDGHIVGVQPP